MATNPLDVVKKLDASLFDLVEKTRSLALGDGALPKKVKFLIAMALDAEHGAVGGVKALAQAAMQAGATKQEVAEALRVAQYIGGVGTVYIAAQALEGIV